MWSYLDLGESRGSSYRSGLYHEEKWQLISIWNRVRSSNDVFVVSRWPLPLDVHTDDCLGLAGAGRRQAELAQVLLGLAGDVVEP